MLPGLTPAHTRKSYIHSKSPDSSGSRLRIESVAPTPEAYIRSPETGVWLLPVDVAETDLVADVKKLYWIIDRAHLESTNRRVEKEEKLARLLGRSSVDGNGCVIGGLRGKQVPARIILDLATLEVGTPTHNAEADIPYISLCGNPDCYNARHSHLEFGSPKFHKKTGELNPNWYRVIDIDTPIETIWGDVLPAVSTSLKYFFEFQRRNFPFVPIDVSPLTPTPISKIIFHPYTGCWESYFYETNSSGLANIKNGYGIMYARQAPDSIDLVTGEISRGYRRGSVLAHNLVWQASGREIVYGLERNHLCNYARCCNPLHIEQIDPDENRSHGHRARAIIRAQERQIPQTIGMYFDKQALHSLHLPVRTLYAELERGQRGPVQP